MFKGGTLTILKTCQWSIFETFLYCQFQSSGTVTLQWQSDTGLANVGYGIHLRTRLIKSSGSRVVVKWQSSDSQITVKNESSGS